jgi:hypothetical protein
VTAAGCATGRTSHLTVYVAARSRSESHLTYMINIALTKEFTLAAGGAR